MPTRFFIRFSLSALRYRRQRLVLAFGALAVAAALATVMFGIYSTVDRRIRNEFRSYGANMVAVAIDGSTVPLSLIASAKQAGASATPLLVTTGRIENQIITVAGVIAPYPYWHVEGNPAIASGKCLAGETLAEQFSLHPGSLFALEGQPCTITGIVSTGGAEDRELIVPFETAAALAGIHDAASAIEIQAPGEHVEAVRAALAKEFPAIDVRTIRAVAGTESNVVVKMRAALLLLTLLILVITTLCVTSNFSEMVIDRAKEIGIMKALGGAERRIAAFFVSESATLAILATIVGYTGGVIAAAAIGREVFGGPFHVELNWMVLAGVCVVLLLVATLATVIATARIWNIQPAVILRGE